MLYCCGGRERREKGEQEHTGAEEALMSCGEADSVTAGNREETPAAEMFDTTDMPSLLPPSGQLQPSPRDSVCQMQHLRVEFNRDCLSPESPQQRLGQRAPKLGQIGRSKRVVIEDEDLDDVMNNNNGPLPVPLSNEPS